VAVAFTVTKVVQAFEKLRWHFASVLDEHG